MANRWPDAERIRDFAARVLVGALFVLLWRNILDDYVRTGRITGLMYLVSEGLVVILTVIRRPAKAIDLSATARVVTTLSVMGPPLIRPGHNPSMLPDGVTVVVLAAGIAIVIYGKMTIGRSFGLVPANRGVVDCGPYNLVRHPIYAGYLLTHAAALVAYPSLSNVTLLVAADIALVWRALVEERVLQRDPIYQAYCARVPWHVVPGIF